MGHDERFAWERGIDAQGAQGKGAVPPQGTRREVFRPPPLSLPGEELGPIQGPEPGGRELANPGKVFAAA